MVYKVLIAYKAGLAAYKPDSYREFSTFNKCLLYLGGKQDKTAFK